jgi:activator of HSP90 ATPase
VWNAGSWTWEEKNFTGWARERLNAILKGFDIDVPGGSVKIVEVASLTGDATINIRKVGVRVCVHERVCVCVFLRRPLSGFVYGARL